MHRMYENGDIVVFWDSDKCFHVHKCVEKSHKTFDPMRKPWIDLSAADTAEIWGAIEACPSGALSCTYRHDIEVRLDEENHRSVALDGDTLIGECDYQETDDGWNVYHTEVSPDYGGKSIAKRLAYCVIEAAEKQKKPIIPTCSYVAKLLVK